MKKLTIIVVAVLVLIVGAFVITSRSGKKPEPASSVEVSSENTITYTDNGFEPATVTVKAGTTIRVKNNSSKSLQFSSDDHPTHTKDKELNKSVLAPGKSETFSVSSVGTNGFHNHLNPDHIGTLIVE